MDIVVVLVKQQYDGEEEEFTYVVIDVVEIYFQEIGITVEKCFPQLENCE